MTVNPDPLHNIRHGVTLRRDRRGWIATCRVCAREAPPTYSPTSALDIWEDHLRQRCTGVTDQQRQALRRNSCQ